MLDRTIHLGLSTGTDGMWLNALGGTHLFKIQHPDVGARPGTLVIRADAPPPKIHVMHFTRDEFKEEDVTDTDQLHAAYDSDTITRGDVQGFGDEPMIRLRRLRHFLQNNRRLLSRVGRKSSKRSHEGVDDYRSDFLPLTFMAGVYGMNFEYMPE